MSRPGRNKKTFFFIYPDFKTFIYLSVSLLGFAIWFSHMLHHRFTSILSSLGLFLIEQWRLFLFCCNEKRCFSKRTFT